MIGTRRQTQLFYILLLIVFCCSLIMLFNSLPFVPQSGSGSDSTELENGSSSSLYNNYDNDKISLTIVINTNTKNVNGIDLIAAVADYSNNASVRVNINSGRYQRNLTRGFKNGTSSILRIQVERNSSGGESSGNSSKQLSHDFSGHDNGTVNFNRNKRESNEGKEILEQTKSDVKSTSLPPSIPLVLCPIISPDLLKGPIQVQLEAPSLDELGNQHKDITFGGHYKPPSCQSRNRVAILIPFRNRERHLPILLYNLLPMLKRQEIEFQVFVIQQMTQFNSTMKQLFNRAMLFNVGFVEANKIYPDWDCFILHDVDLVPENDKNLYDCPQVPRHMKASAARNKSQSTQVAVNASRDSSLKSKSKFKQVAVHSSRGRGRGRGLTRRRRPLKSKSTGNDNEWLPPYSTYFGGVSALLKEHYIKVNGFSNMYWGWGGEDDDFSDRLFFYGLNFTRVSRQVGRYRMLKHEGQPLGRNRFKLLKSARTRFSWDGLTNLSYTVERVIPYRTYTLINALLHCFNCKLY